MQKIITDLKITTGGILEFMVLKILSGKTNHVKSVYEEGNRGFGIKTYYLTENGMKRLSSLENDWKRLCQLIASTRSS